MAAKGPYVENEVESIRQARGYNSNYGMTIGGASNIDFSASTGTFKFPSGGAVGQVMNIMTQTTTTVLTAAQTGSLVLWNAAAGFTITLPAPVVGLNFSFGVLTSVTSSNHKLITDAGTTFLVGGLVMTESADTNAGLGAAFDGSTDVAVTMNGTTTGGLIGTFFNVYCVAATKWMVEGIVYGSGTLSTPAATS